MSDHDLNESPFEMPEMEWDKIQTERQDSDLALWALVMVAAALLFGTGFLFGVYAA